MARYTGTSEKHASDERRERNDLVESVGKEFIARQIVVLIGRSIHEAVAHTELAGKVDIHDVREVKPDAARK